MPQIQMQIIQSCAQQGLQHEGNHFQITLRAGVPKQLGTHLQRTTGAPAAIGPGVQHRTQVTQAPGAIAAQHLGVDTGRLRRDVRSHTHQAATQLIGDLEGFQIQMLSRARQQRLQVFDQGRIDGIVAPRPEQIHDRAAQQIHRPSMGRQHLGDSFGQEPAVFHAHGRLAPLIGPRARSANPWPDWRAPATGPHGAATG